MRSDGGQRGVLDAARTSSRSGARRARPAARPPGPTQPGPEPPALQDQPGPGVQLARVVADQVAEQPERRALGARRRGAPRGAWAARRSRPAGRRARGSPTRARRRRASRAAASGCRTTSSTPTARNGTTWATVLSVHSAPRRRRRCASARGRQWTAASSGSPAARGGRAAARAAAGSAAGDRQPQDHELGVDGQLGHLLGVPLPVLTMAK